MTTFFITYKVCGIFKIYDDDLSCKKKLTAVQNIYNPPQKGEEHNITSPLYQQQKSDSCINFSESAVYMLLNNWRPAKYKYLPEYSNNVWSGHRRFWGASWLWERTVSPPGWGRGEVAFPGGTSGSGRRALWPVGTPSLSAGSWTLYATKITTDPTKHRVYITHWKHHLGGLWWKWVNKSMIEIKCFQSTTISMT